MKLYISNIGITESVRTYVEDTKQNLNNARSVYLSCPSTFQYASYIRSLTQKINDFSKETTYINNALIKSERKYDSCFENEKNIINNIKEKTVPPRNGLNVSL